MRDSNRSRFALFLGKDDWGRFRAPSSAEGTWRTLDQTWNDPAAACPVSWNRKSGSLELSARTQGFKASANDFRPTLDDRRSAARDRFGNVYRISQDRTSILVTNSGDGSDSRFWPPPVARTGSGSGAFRPASEPRPSPPTLAGLAVLPGHHLLCGIAGDAPGFHLFDLVAGGPPTRIDWTRSRKLSIHDMACSADGTVAVLDRTDKVVWMLDRALDTGAPRRDPATSAFGPDPAAPAIPAPDKDERLLPWKLDASWDPVAVDLLPDGSCLVLERRESSGFGRISLYRQGRLAGSVSLEQASGVLRGADGTFTLRGHDLVVDLEDPSSPAALVVSEDGNQAWRFVLEETRSTLEARVAASELPLRRYAGIDLVGGPSGAWYLSDGAWVPLVELRRRRHAPEAVVVSPRIDGGLPGTAWHRVMLDGQIPSGSSVVVSARAADTEADLESSPFREQPAPVLRRSGSEIPWSGIATDAGKGQGTWELLLQSIKGRFLELRLRLECDEMRTPSLHAVRVWNPRFSYVDEYLPPIYREDESSRDFLERFLANFEGMLTSMEDRIVGSTALFDVRTAPDSTLDWLAGWLGLALDPALDERRRRLLIRHAPTLFSYRGTPQGIILALRIGMSECLRDQDFALPAPSQTQPFGIRIVERFLTRGRSPAFTGQTMSDLESAESTTVAAWTPSMGAAELHRRWSKATGGNESEFPILQTKPELQALWTGFCLEQIGLVPSFARDTIDACGVLPETVLSETGNRKVDWLGNPNAMPPKARHRLERWQGYLRRRWLDIERLNNAWKRDCASFESIPPFARVPDQEEALRDWIVFETFLEPIHSLAHRFRVLIPTAGPLDDPADFERRRDHARRIAALEKPAHTSFDVEPYWALFRLGQARLGLDTVLDAGSRADAFAPWFRLGSSHVGSTRIPYEPPPDDRIRLDHALGRKEGE
ncbi:MAG TPA: phage tail protein [Fibrobacteria bacterium]|nr:phage tail protein [Fibrobacteria bacterium]